MRGKGVVIPSSRHGQPRSRAPTPQAIPPSVGRRCSPVGNEGRRLARPRGRNLSGSGGGADLATATFRSRADPLGESALAHYGVRVSRCVYWNQLPKRSALSKPALRARP